MKKQTTNNYTAGAQARITRKNLTTKTNSRYTYTEADLGEDILYAGLNLSATSKQSLFSTNYDRRKSYTF